MTEVNAALKAQLRARAEQAIERLLVLLDALDGDADVEPSLGALDGKSGGSDCDQRLWAAGGDQGEREEVSEGEGDHDEREPDVAELEPDYHPDDQRRIRMRHWEGLPVYTGPDGLVSLLSE